MSSWEIVVIWLKFVSETDWLGEMNGADISTSGITLQENDNHTIRHSKSTNESLVQINRTLLKQKRKQKVLVMPKQDLNTIISFSEEQTIANASQTHLYKEMLMSEKHNTESNKSPSSLIEAFQASTDGPVFLDPSLSCNFLAHCSPSAMRELKREAKRTLHIIHQCEEKTYGVFGNIFCKPSRFWRKFDSYVKIPIDQLDSNKIWNVNKEKNYNDYDGIDNWKHRKNDLGKRECITRGIIDILSMALGDRITCIRPLTTGNGEGSEFQSIHNSLLEAQQIKDENISDSDQVPTISGTKGKGWKKGGDGMDEYGPHVSTCLPTYIVLGFRFNPETAFRIVDRGPPAENSKASSLFVSLWGKQLAQLRRFKDGAIVHAVVWKDVILSGNECEFSDVNSNGGIVEKIIQHVLQLHFLKQNSDVTFEMRNMMSLVDGFDQKKRTISEKRFNDSNYLHKDVMKAFESLCITLKENVGQLGLPLAIDAVEPISPCLRYSSLFPPIPHPLLGGSKDIGFGSKVSSVTPGQPILIQIRFEGSDKWPTDVGAMGAAKCAMLISLASSIDKGKFVGFSGPAIVYPGHLDVGFKGYSWRIIVRADQELRMLSSLKKPSAEAIRLHQIFTKRHILSSLHHSAIHAVHTSHPSAPSAVRLVQRWISAHMLSGHLSIEAIELIVAELYVNPYPLEAPSTAVAGFLRFLNRFGNFDWAREPFIVDPQGHLTAKDMSQIRAEFEVVRGNEYKNGPAMYIISPFDHMQLHGSNSNLMGSQKNSFESRWKPTSTESSPEKVILHRMTSLAQLSYRSIMRSYVKEKNDEEWSFIFQESSSSMRSYSVLLRISSDLVVDKNCCSSLGSFHATKNREGETESPFTRSLKKRFFGPKSLKIKLYKNLSSNARNRILHGWQPVEELVANLKSKLNSMAVFFYNEFSPNVIALLWRPSAFRPCPFSVANAEYKCPVDEINEDSLLTTNSDDVLREIDHMGEDIVVNMKILDDRSVKGGYCAGSSVKRKAKSLEASKDHSSSEDEGDDFQDTI